MIAKISKDIHINLDQFVESHKTISDSGQTSVRIYTVANNADQWITLYDEDAINFLLYLNYISVDLSQCARI